MPSYPSHPPHVLSLPFPPTASLSALTAVALRYFCSSSVTVIQRCQPQRPSPTSTEHSNFTALFQPYEHPDRELGDDGDLPLLRDPSTRFRESAQHVPHEDAGDNVRRGRITKCPEARKMRLLFGSSTHNTG